MINQRSSFLGQPRAFYLIFFIEIWERFGFYGVQALLVLYMVQFLHYHDAHADTLFTSFSALVYLLPALGGYVGDRLIGTKRAILLGAVVLTLGYFLLSFLASQHLAFPLAVIAVGNGLFKANPSSLLSKLYQQLKANQDSGFTLYYMSINIGALLSFLLTPVLGRYLGWHWAFFCCFVGLVMAVLNYFLMSRWIVDIGSLPDFKPLEWNKFLLIIVGTLLLIYISHWLLDHKAIMVWLLLLGSFCLLLIFGLYIIKAAPYERKGMLLFLVLFLQAVVFFVMYFQIPTSINLFVLRNVNYGPIPPASFQALNPIWILIISPLLAFVYNRLSRKKVDFSLPTKFALGTFLTSLAFLVLPLGMFFAKQGMVNPLWVVLSYALQSTGELLVSALGLSLVSRFIPQRLVGYSMGLWFLSTSLASIIAGHVASIAAIPSKISHDPIASLAIYHRLFSHIGLVTLFFSVIMFALVPALKYLIVHPVGSDVSSK